MMARVMSDARRERALRCAVRCYVMCTSEKGKREYAFACPEGQFFDVYSHMSRGTLESLIFPEAEEACSVCYDAAHLRILSSGTERQSATDFELRGLQLLYLCLCMMLRF